MSSFREVLKQPFFTRFLIARMISNLGNGMSPTALAFAVLALPGAHAADLSKVLTAQAIPLVLMLPVGGVLADRFGRAKMIASMDIVLSLVVVAMAALFALDKATIPLLMLLMFLAGILNAFWWPAYPGLPTDLVAEPQLQTANSAASLASNSALIFGAALGGYLVSTVGSAIAIAVDALTFLIAGLIVASFRHVSMPAPSSESMADDLVHGWKIFWSYKWVVVVVAGFSFIVLAIRATEGVLGPLVAKTHFDGAISWSRVVAAEGVGLLVGALLASRWHPRRPMVAGMLATFPGALLPLSLAFPTPLIFVMLSSFLWGAGIELMAILWFTSLQKKVQPEAIGRVSAYDAFGSLAFGPVGLALAGPLADSWGTRPVLFAAAALVLLMCGLVLLHKDVRGLTS